MPIAPFEAIVLKKVGESGSDGTTDNDAEVLGDETGAEMAGRGAMQPHRRAGSVKRLHPLRQQPQGKAGQHVSGAGGGQLARRVGIDRGAPVRRRDDSIAALQDDHGAALPSRGAGALQFAGFAIAITSVAKQALKFTLMRS